MVAVADDNVVGVNANVVVALRLLSPVVTQHIPSPVVVAS